MHLFRNEIDQAFLLASKADAADRGGHHLGAARGDRVEHELAVGIARGAEKEARGELAASDDQGIGHGASLLYPPCRARTISTLSPGESRVCGQAARGTIAPLSATAMPRRPVSTAFSASSAASVAATSG